MDEWKNEYMKIILPFLSEMVGNKKNMLLIENQTHYSNGLAQECGNSLSNALECAKPSTLLEILIMEYNRNFCALHWVVWIIEIYNKSHALMSVSRPEPNWLWHTQCQAYQIPGFFLEFVMLFSICQLPTPFSSTVLKRNLT